MPTTSPRSERRIEIPAPAAWVSANDRTHWRVKAERVKAWRLAASVLGRLVSRTPMGTPVDITVTVHRTSARRADASNLAPTAKAVIDGLTDAGWWPDDDDQHIVSTTFVAGQPKARPTLTITATRRTA